MGLFIRLKTIWNQSNFKNFLSILWEFIVLREKSIFVDTVNFKITGFEKDSKIRIIEVLYCEFKV